MTPRMCVCIVQMYSYVPRLLNVYENVLPAVNSPLSNIPLGSQVPALTELQGDSASPQSAREK